MKKSNKVESTMKRVLITVPEVIGSRFGCEMQRAVDSLLTDGLYSGLGSTLSAQQFIFRVGGEVLAYLEECSWLPEHSGACPPQFVLNLPAWMWKEGVPEYTGEIRREAK